MNWIIVDDEAINLTMIEGIEIMACGVNNGHVLVGRTGRESKVLSKKFRSNKQATEHLYSILKIDQEKK